MNAKSLLIFGVSMLSLSFSGPAFADENHGQYVQIAELEIDPAQLANYKAAVQEQIDAAIRLEPGVLVLYAVSERDNPSHVKVFEIYTSIDAYNSHLQAEHFTKYKRTTDAMVKSLKLVRLTPLWLGPKPK